ncbi:peroxidase 2-like [Actinidia eriantha]|uniref:peroxidase 2-like n=1 Tax=Actinidia eriantha TaxID=165200 RepID=UPI00258A84B4|nr:peroxidase 2-like [Actinidia eriantha]
MNSFQYLALALCAVSIFGGSNAQLSATFYDSTCPNVSSVARGILVQARQTDVRIGAKIIRLHFHDCMVNGCDASLLLDDAEGIDSEKDEPPNTTIDGYSVLDDIKTAVENVCPGVVSCADIVALAAQISVSLDGGPTNPWEVQFGRRDSTTANSTGTSAIPGPFDDFRTVRKKFTDVGLDSTDMVALSGAHTIGKARCLTFNQRFDSNDSSAPMDPTFREELIQACTTGETLVDFDPTTPNGFDNNYYTNLQNKRGLLTTDQFLFSTNGSDTIPIVNQFASSQSDFFYNFGQSMVKLGNISPLTGNNGQIRADCRRVNYLSIISGQRTYILSAQK